MKNQFLLLGSGLSNQAVGRFFDRNGISFVVSDTRKDCKHRDYWVSHYGDAIWWDFETCINQLDRFSTVVVSPGIPLDNPLVLKASSKGLKIISELELFAQQNVKPILAITGTNGKSTVTRLVEHILQNAGVNAVAAGNIGQPALDLLTEDYAVAVLEVSSFQLETISSLKPQASVLLNIGHDHLDRHQTIENYLSIKAQLLNASKTAIAQHSITLQKKADITFSAREGAGDYRIQEDEGIPYIYRGNDRLIQLIDLQCVGQHGAENMMASWALARAIGLSDAVISTSIKGFKSLKYRCEVLGTLDGVQWINDSKGTNVEALLAALSGFSEKKVLLIAGGQSKNQTLSPLQDAFKRCVKKIFSIGEDGASFLSLGVKGTHYASLAEALKAAHKASKSGDVVLLSPACSSFDMFDSFEHRGQVFTDYFEQIASVS